MLTALTENANSQARSEATGFGSLSAVELEQPLRAWVTSSILVVKNNGGQDALLIRFQPVRADIKIDDVEIAADVRREIANLAITFQLPYEFTSLAPNMIVATGKQIADAGGKPDEDFLRDLGLPPSDVKQVSSGIKWAQGCGSFVFLDKSGRVARSIAVASTSPQRDLVRRCVATAVLHNFGLRMNVPDVVGSAHDYVQHLLLARAIMECENRPASQHPAEAASVKDAYVECAVERLKLRLAK